MKNFPKYKISPLRVWREQYKYVSAQIRTLKNEQNQPSRFKRYRQQSRIEFMRDQARTLMDQRPAALLASQQLSAERHAQLKSI